MTYTASEMREMATLYDNFGVISEGEFHRNKRTAQMLRQAADAMEKDERRKALDDLTALSQELGLYDIQRPK